MGEIERREKPFEVVSEFEPSGDQPTAIAQLDERLNRGERDVVLMGATGTGKSATAAWLIEKQQRPTLVMAPNKTLAAQLAKADYLLGDRLTAADLHWGNALKWTTGFGIVPTLPVFMDYIARVDTHPACVRARELDAALLATMAPSPASAD